jgi:hypothetical protein
VSISLALLAQPHSVAARSIVLEALKPEVDIDNLIVGQSTIRSDGDGNLPVFIHSDAYNDPEWPYSGSVTLQYQRVDLQEALGHLNLRFYVGAEYQTEDIVTRLSALLDLHFESADYVHETFPLITAGRIVTLYAALDSPRWKGQVDIFVYR